MTKNVCGLLVFLSHFNGTWIFWTDLRKIIKYQISCRSTLWESIYSMWTDGQRQTDRHDEANSRFSDFMVEPNEIKQTLDPFP